ncbi:hypothetical protein EYF80_009486 [Liparis tanakae]|uniref:Uncharacterized protein n=1 Tax=Liparis tanakae TaxID=230148 RepID=A0A4Z2IQQ8_9TELE|nr:hypothetical protein EYF80_009486 [Liparis tanakae]
MSPIHRLTNGSKGGAVYLRSFQRVFKHCHSGEEALCGSVVHCRPLCGVDLRYSDALERVHAELGNWIHRDSHSALTLSVSCRVMSLDSAAGSRSSLLKAGSTMMFLRAAEVLGQVVHAEVFMLAVSLETDLHMQRHEGRFRFLLLGHAQQIPASQASDLRCQKEFVLLLREGGALNNHMVRSNSAKNLPTVRFVPQSAGNPVSLDGVSCLPQCREVVDATDPGELVTRCAELVSSSAFTCLQKRGGREMEMAMTQAVTTIPVARPGVRFLE